jgi:hypothetical protein
MVTSALFTDFDQNGSPDLLISTEWGALRLYSNEAGALREVTDQVGLGTFKGWWNGVATGDFNNDGRPDIVATNMGANSPYQIETGRPLKLFYGDFNWDRRLHVVDAYYDPVRGAYVPRRKLHDFDAIPRILRNVQTHEAFARGTVQEIFDIKADAPAKEITTVEHLLFLRGDDGFAAHSLPAEVQFTAAFYAGVADFDNDGNEDLFLAQNYFGFPEPIPRLDAGRGLVLRGEGTGRFEPIGSMESGLAVYGEQRGAALADFDHDGRVDLAVSQNGDSTRLFLNMAERRGLRIQLIGPASNPDAVGSSLRLVYKDGTKGPRREIQAGSGYWSQNSFTQVMGMGGEVDRIDVLWFDGRETERPFAEGQMDYQIVF